MATLFVTEPGTQVKKEDERLVLVRDDEIVEDIPFIKVDRIVLMGRGVSLTTPALHELTRRGAEVVYLSGSGRFLSRVVGTEHKHTRLRYEQTLHVAEPARALRLARAIVLGKVRNQAAVIRRLSSEAGGPPHALTGLLTAARQAETAATLDELRGFEGLAARDYFFAFRRLLRAPSGGGSWGFELRAYYPPPDPINALLSFGYTLLLNDLVTACQLTGLDPYLGCFHAIDYGRPSLALDLEEEFRPLVVDGMVLALANRGLVRPADFENRRAAQPAGATGFYLTQEARGRFLAAYEERVSQPVLYPATGERTPFRRVFSLQAQAMARVFLGEAERYSPYSPA